MPEQHEQDADEILKILGQGAAKPAAQGATPTYDKALYASGTQGASQRRVAGKVAANPSATGATGVPASERLERIKRNMETPAKDVGMTLEGYVGRSGQKATMPQSFGMGGAQGWSHVGGNLAKLASTMNPMNPGRAGYGSAIDAAIDASDESLFRDYQQDNPISFGAGYGAGQMPLFAAGGAAGEAAGLPGAMANMGGKGRFFMQILQDAGMTVPSLHGDVTDQAEQLGAGLAGGLGARGVGAGASAATGAIKRMWPSVKNELAPVGEEVGGLFRRRGAPVEAVETGAEIPQELGLGLEEGGYPMQGLEEGAPMPGPPGTWREPPKLPPQQQAPTMQDILGQAIEGGQKQHQGLQEGVKEALAPHMKDVPPEFHAEFLDKMSPQIEKILKNPADSQAQLTLVKNMKKLTDAYKLKAQKAAEEAAKKARVDEFISGKKKINIGSPPEAVQARVNESYSRRSASNAQQELRRNLEHRNLVERTIRREASADRSSMLQPGTRRTVLEMQTGLEGKALDDAIKRILGD